MPLPRKAWQALKDVQIALETGKPIETDDWVAMASEFRAIATLPGVENARIWEPEPATIYSWQR